MDAIERLRLSPDPASDPASADEEPFAVPRPLLAEMLAHIEAGYPDEACGVLAGAAGRVAWHLPVTNAAATPHTFCEIGPQERVALWAALAEHGWELLAFYHSHPASPPYPSPDDIAWAQNWPGLVTIIFSLAERDWPMVRAFHIRGQSVRECQVVIADEV